MEGIRRALVLGLVLIAGTAIEQAPSIGPQGHDIIKDIQQGRQAGTFSSKPMLSWVQVSFRNKKSNYLFTNYSLKNVDNNSCYRTGAIVARDCSIT